MRAGSYTLSSVCGGAAKGTCRVSKSKCTARISHNVICKAGDVETHPVGRRLLGGLCLVSFLSVGGPEVVPVANAAPGAGPLDKPLSGPQIYKTDSGIKVQELTPGDGIAPEAGDKVLIDYVLRRANGYFIYATVEGVSFQPSDVPVGPVALTIPASPGEGPMIPGLAEVLLRMRQGGKLRAFIPPELGYTDCKTLEPQPPTFATKRQLCNHNREPLLMEVALRRVLK